MLYDSEYWALKGQNKRSDINDRKIWFDSYRGKNDRKLIKVVWTFKCHLRLRRIDHIVLSPVQRARGRAINTLEEIIKRDFMLNIILKFSFCLNLIIALRDLSS